MVTLTGRIGLTITAIVFEMDGFPVGQVTFEVRLHETMSPLEGVYRNTELFGPEGIPLTNH